MKSWLSFDKFKSWKEHRVVESVAQKIREMVEKREVAQKLGLRLLICCRDSRMTCRSSRRDFGLYRALILAVDYHEVQSKHIDR